MERRHDQPTFANEERISWYSLLLVFMVLTDFLSDVEYGQQTFVSKTSSQHPPGHWTKEAGINMRKFFDDYARSNALDPLNPEHWYNVKRESIIKAGV
jgi:hypothetical protein